MATHSHFNGIFYNYYWRFKKIKILAEIIAKDFCYIRVDLYNIGSDIYFGELTFHPGSGFERFSPQKWDRIFGNQLILQVIL